MGTYIYTLKKKLNKNASLGDEMVVVGQATYLCKQIGSGDYSSSEKREMTRAYSLSDNWDNDIPKYITFDGEMVYKNNRRAVWSDGCGFYTGIDNKKDFVGTLKKVGRKFVIEK
jgi:hypothetical protein